MLKELLKNNMKKEEKEYREEVIFDVHISYRELFWNGLIFMLVGVVYDISLIAPQLPSNWKEDTSILNEIETGWVLQFLLFVISYILLSNRFFGANIKAIKKYNIMSYTLRKIALITSIILVSSILKVSILLTFF